MSTRLRAAAAAIAVLAFLIFLNFQQVDDDNEMVFRTSGVLANNVDRVIRDRQSQAMYDATYECLSLVVAGAGVIVAIAGGRMQRGT